MNDLVFEGSYKNIVALKVSLSLSLSMDFNRLPLCLRHPVAFPYSENPLCSGYFPCSSHLSCSSSISHFLPPPPFSSSGWRKVNFIYRARWLRNSGITSSFFRTKRKVCVCVCGEYSPGEF